MSKKSQNQVMADNIKVWKTDFVKWCDDLIGIKLDKQQIAIANSVVRLVNAKFKAWKGGATEEQRQLAKKMGVCVDSGRGIGKTTIAALLLLWFMCCFPMPLVLAVAPKKELLKDNLWAEISKWLRHSNDHLSGASILNHMFELQSEKMFYKQFPPELKSNTGKKWVSLARTTSKNASEEDQKATISGYHEEFMFIVVDEAYGVPEKVYEPLDKTLTGPVNIMLMIGNPTKNTGFARTAQTKLSKYWITHRLSGEESSLISKDFLDRQLDTCGGRDTNAYRVNILGMPPKSESDALIPWEWIEEAKDRWEAYQGLEDDQYRVYGCDIGGGGGDLTAIVFRIGNYVKSIRTIDTPDDKVTIRFISENAMEDEPDDICIDSIGIGHGTYWHFPKIARIHSVKFSGRSRYPEKYKTIRDELYFRVRDWFQSGDAMIPPDDDLCIELSLLKADEPDTGGFVKVTSKRKLKEKLDNYKSPNKADALAYSFFIDNKILKRRKSMKQLDRFERAYNRRKTGQGAYTWMSV